MLNDLCLKCVHDKVIRHWFRPIEFSCDIKDKWRAYYTKKDGAKHCESYEPTEQARIESKDW